MSFETLKTDSKNADFIKLITFLDGDLEERYGHLQKQYEKHNKVDFLKDVIVIYCGKVPVGCGAFKKYNKNTIEIKRIFVLKEYRNQGLAKVIMNELEESARSIGAKYAVLETGIKQYEAISLYQKIGYQVTQNYGPYIGNSNSVCMLKVL